MCKVVSAVTAIGVTCVAVCIKVSRDISIGKHPLKIAAEKVLAKKKGKLYVFFADERLSTR